MYSDIGMGPSLLYWLRRRESRGVADRHDGETRAIDWTLEI